MVAGVEGHHPAPAVTGIHQPRQQFVLWVRAKPRIVDGVSERSQAVGQMQRIAAMLAQPDVQAVQILEDARRARAVEHRTEEHARSGVDVVELANEFARRDDAAGDTVTGAVDELGQAVDDDIGAVTQGRQDHWREGIVNHQPGTGGVRDGGELRQVADLQERIAERFAVEDPGPWRHRCTHCVHVAQIDEAGVHAETRQQVLQQGIGAAVNAAAADDLVTGGTQRHQGRADRTHPGSHDLRRFAVLHPFQRTRQVLVGRVEMARVEEAALDLVLEKLLHSLGAEEGVGRRVGDRWIDVTKLAENQIVLYP
ncbi:MAG: hypothetical protein AW07_01411 [Candidatus Accumulibacter sp. SK-11]|nr:MAG: hypothetical protein AW07_01411 [Candidatus Accumulibacter sp. SK-11]